MNTKKELNLEELEDVTGGVMNANSQKVGVGVMNSSVGSMSVGDTAMRDWAVANSAVANSSVGSVGAVGAVKSTAVGTNANANANANQNGSVGSLGNKTGSWKR